MIGKVGDVVMYLEVYSMSIGDWVEVRTPGSVGKMGDVRMCYEVEMGEGRVKGVGGGRVGYYGGGWGSPAYAYGFPLDPKRNIRYVVKDHSNFTGNSADQVAACWIFTLRNDYNSQTKTFTNSTLASTG